MKPRRHVLITVITAAGLVVLAAATIALVDPYGLHDRTGVQGFNAKKPRAGTQLRVSKERRASRAAAKTVIFGNSRIQVGFNPDSAAWPQNARPVFNFGIPGAPFDDVLSDYGLLVAEAKAPKSILIGLDLEDFLSNLSAPEDLDIPTGSAGRWPHMPYPKLAETNLSLTALIDSLRTVAAQTDPFAADLTRAGFNPFWDFIPIIDREGHHAVALPKILSSLRHYVALPTDIYLADGREALPLRQLRVLLADARRRRIDVRLFLYPYHTDLLETFRVCGTWPSFERWKRALTQIVAELRRSDPDWRLDLWDFATYNRYTEEPIPDPGDRDTDMAWYWEPGHFKAALGDLLIARLYGAGPDDFGLLLTPDSVEAGIDADRARGQEFRRRHPEAVARVAALCRQVGGRTP